MNNVGAIVVAVVVVTAATAMVASAGVRIEI